MTDLELAWLAGLLEGEGCFDSHRNQPRIRLKMSDPDTIIRAATLMGAAWHPDRRSHETAARTGHRPLYVTALTGVRAIALMTLLLPHLSARRTQRVTSILTAWDMRDRPPMRPVPAGDALDVRSTNLRLVLAGAKRTG